MVFGFVFSEVVKEKDEPVATAEFSAGVKSENLGLTHELELLLLP
jgi:hypothetical protein